MNSIKQVFIHIDPTKTGSSTLQLFLSNNRDVLENNCVLYPKFEISDPTNHGVIVRNLRNHDAMNTVKVWDELFDQITKCITANTLILSAEGLSKLNISQIKLLKYKLNLNNIKILFYTRRQDDL